jgi:uncharacterized membrane protein YuzA (DUF378 family)
MKALCKISAWILVLGGLAWGIEGLWEVNVFDAVLGQAHVIESLVDIIIGIAALIVGYSMIKDNKCCCG